MSDTTYRDDRHVNIPLHVRAGVPARIANIGLRQVERYETVENLALPHGRVVGENASVEILGVAIPVASVLIPGKG